MSPYDVEAARAARIGVRQTARSIGRALGLADARPLWLTVWDRDAGWGEEKPMPSPGHRSVSPWVALIGSPEQVQAALEARIRCAFIAGVRAAEKACEDRRKSIIRAGAAGSSRLKRVEAEMRRITTLAAAKGARQCCTAIDSLLARERADDAYVAQVLSPPKDPDDLAVAEAMLADLRVQRDGAVPGAVRDVLARRAAALERVLADARRPR